MYGILMESIQHFIKKEYGQELWEQVMERAGYPRSTVFTTYDIYPDNIIMKLAEAAADVIQNGSSADEFLMFYGRWFILYSNNFGHDKFIKACGRYFFDFLTCADNLHLQLKYIFPKMIMPSIYVNHADPNGAVVTYRTQRKGLLLYLAGILKQIAKDYYGIHHLSVTELPASPDLSSPSSEGNKYRLRLNFDNRDYFAHRAVITGQVEPIDRGRFIDKTLPAVTGKVMMQLFPFTLVVRPDLKIMQAGNKLKELYPPGTFVGQSLPAVVKMRRPKLSVTWDNLFSLQKVMCEMELLPEHYRTVKTAAKFNPSRRSTEELLAIACRIFLQGQTRYIDDWNAIIFLGNPLVNNLEDLAEMSLTVNDLSLHGNSRDMMMKGWQHNARLENLYEETEERSKLLEKSLQLLGESKKCGDMLLYSMMPQSVADRLRAGEPPVNTCQAFESVTVLFVEMTEAETSLMAARLAQSSASDAVSAVSSAVVCINYVFSCFDRLIDGHNVYKVETVGNIYMVVGGAPEKNNTHVRDIAEVALNFRDEINELALDDGTGLSFPVRVGVHTGPAVAGVVGTKMPRYCFFGNTINTAARMQSTGLPGKIQLSQQTYDRLNRDHKGEFTFDPRGTVVVKGKGLMNTWWLTGHSLTSSPK